MRVLLPCLFGLMLPLAVAASEGVSGAGATIPYSVYKKWGEVYNTRTGMQFNYQGTDSSDGVRQILSSNVDFGASDRPLKPEELKMTGLFQFPVLVSGVVPVVNITGIRSGQLRLTGPVLADIYLGRITRWNDRAIASLNPDLRLPNAKIEAVYRSDASEITLVFTNYLSRVSPEWKAFIGEGTTVSWRHGSGCRGNALMPLCMARLENSIAYVEYGFAARNRMNFVRMKNHDGQYLLPGEAAFQSAAAKANWERSTGFYEMLTDQPGANSWPLVGATFILMRKEHNKPETVRNVLKFFEWAYSQGGGMASELGYAPLPASVQQRIREAWLEQLGKTGDADSCAGRSCERTGTMQGRDQGKRRARTLAKNMRHKPANMLGK